MKMKSIYLVLIIFFLLNDDASAQYRYNKNKYNVEDFVPQYGDKYSPFGCGLASFFIPGLGQAIAGEPVRGLKFLGIELVTIGIGTALANAGTSENPYAGIGFGMVLILTVRIIDAADAVKVAKVNNMAAWDLKKSTGSFYMMPKLDWCIVNQNAIGIKVGYTF